MQKSLQANAPDIAMTMQTRHDRTTKDIRAAGNRLLLSVAGQWLVRQRSNNLIGSTSWKRQWVKTATEKQQPKRYSQCLK